MRECILTFVMEFTLNCYVTFLSNKKTFMCLKYPLEEQCWQIWQDAGAEGERIKNFLGPDKRLQECVQKDYL